MIVIWIPACAGMTELEGKICAFPKNCRLVAEMMEYMWLLIADMIECLIFFLDCFALLAMTALPFLCHSSENGNPKKARLNYE
jgi:hypothetical protein